jgi:dCMP deaminase
MEDPRPSWDDTFIEIAAVLAKRSKDENTKIGAVIVGPSHEIRGMGYNCFPRGINDDDPERQKRPHKYKFFEHAERNALYNAARIGTPLEGCTVYIPGYPCADCARGMIQSGIKEIVCESVVIPERWMENCAAADEMVREAGISIRLKNSTGHQPPQLGEEWGK